MLLLPLYYRSITAAILSDAALVGTIPHPRPQKPRSMALSLSLRAQSPLAKASSCFKFHLISFTRLTEIVPAVERQCQPHIARSIRTVITPSISTITSIAKEPFIVLARRTLQPGSLLDQFTVQEGVLRLRRSLNCPGPRWRTTPPTPLAAI